MLHCLNAEGRGAWVRVISFIRSFGRRVQGQPAGPTQGILRSSSSRLRGWDFSANPEIPAFESAEVVTSKYKGALTAGRTLMGPRGYD